MSTSLALHPGVLGRRVAAFRVGCAHCPLAWGPSRARPPRNVRATREARIALESRTEGSRVSYEWSATSRACPPQSARGSSSREKPHHHHRHHNPKLLLLIVLTKTKTKSQIHTNELQENQCANSTHSATEKTQSTSKNTTTTKTTPFSTNPPHHKIVPFAHLANEIYLHRTQPVLPLCVKTAPRRHQHRHLYHPKNRSIALACLVMTAPPP